MTTLKIFTTVLDRFEPMKTLAIRGNHQPHVNNTLRKAIMTRSRPKSITITKQGVFKTCKPIKDKETFLSV